MAERGLVEPGVGEHDLLATQQRGGERQDQVLARGAEPGGGVDPARFQQAPAPAEGALADRVEDHIVVRAADREVPGRVVDDLVGAQLAGQFELRGGAYRGYPGIEGL